MKTYTVEYDTKGVEGAPIRNQYGQWTCRKCAERWAMAQEASAKLQNRRPLNVRLFESSSASGCACYCGGDSAARMDALIKEAA